QHVVNPISNYFNPKPEQFGPPVPADINAKWFRESAINEAGQRQLQWANDQITNNHKTNLDGLDLGLDDQGNPIKFNDLDDIQRYAQKASTGGGLVGLGTMTASSAVKPTFQGGSAIMRGLAKKFPMFAPEAEALGNAGQTVSRVASKFNVPGLKFLKFAPEVAALGGVDSAVNLADKGSDAIGIQNSLGRNAMRGLGSVGQIAGPYVGGRLGMAAGTLFGENPITQGIGSIAGSTAGGMALPFINGQLNNANNNTFINAGNQGYYETAAKQLKDILDNPDVPLNPNRLAGWYQAQNQLPQGLKSFTDYLQNNPTLQRQIMEHRQ
ncbi:MAG TPA: hypothetical protein VNZ45_15445, partial [Bacteroidia bacterium]|nr:hypothetical protein [Bacteroidia bacterium]